VARNALGRGLGALIRDAEGPPVVTSTSSPSSGIATSAAAGSGAATATAPARVAAGPQAVDIDLIDPSPYQPRTRFREESLAELAQSIQSTGIVQPLVVRQIGTRYQLLAGERRWRAAQRIGLTKVPVILKDVSDETALEITLVENIQREDLNAVDEARAFERFMSEFHLTQEEVATRTGKDRATVANAVRLLRLDKPILDLIEDGRVSAGHGRALLGITDGKARIALARRASRGGLTVRQIERLSARRSRAGVAPAPPVLDANTRSALDQLQQALGTRVTLRPPAKNKPGQLQIEYYSDEQLAGIYDRLVE
jgi:ParB family transcriptional regulator, chromosome partitioning protein